MDTFDRYTSKYLSILLNIEIQFCSFVSVFSYKASKPTLKSSLLEICEQASRHQDELQNIMKELDLNISDLSSDGIRGIFKEAFLMMEDSKDPISVDGIMIFALIQAGYYKLSHYHHIHSLLSHKDLAHHTAKVEQMIQSEESTIFRLQKNENSIHKAKFNKEVEASLVV